MIIKLIALQILHLVFLVGNYYMKEGVKLFHLLVFGLEFHSCFIKFQVRIQGVDQLLTLRIWRHIPFKSFFFLVKCKNLKKTTRDE